MGDHVAHKDPGNESVHLESEIVIEDRLREQSGAGAVVAPLEVLLVQVALVGQRECPLLPISDHADDPWSPVSIVGLRPADTHVSDVRQHGPNLPNRGHDYGSPATGRGRRFMTADRATVTLAIARVRPMEPDTRAPARRLVRARAIVRSGAPPARTGAIQSSRAVSGASPNGSCASVIAPAAGELAGEGDHSDRAAPTMDERTHPINPTGADFKPDGR